MYICICNAVKESAIEQAVATGTRCFDEFSKRTGCSQVCGTCKCDAQALFSEALAAQRRPTRKFEVQVAAYA